MKKLFCCLLLPLLLLPLALCGCGSGSETTVVRLNEVTHSVFYAPQYVAMSQGFFADEGLEVELTNGGGADKVMTAVVSGQSDIGLAGPESCIYVYNQGKDDYPVIFAQLTKRDGSFLVGRTDEDFSWENLRGKTIIGGRKGGVPEMTLEYVMAQNGVTPHADAVVDTSVQFNMMAGAFTGGHGDYVALFEPTATEVELAGKGHILCSIGEESGEIPYTAYFATQSYMAEYPEVIQGFTNAIARAQRWIAEHSDREVAEAIADQFPDTSIDLLEKVTARHRQIDAWNTTPVMEQQALERLETVMEHAGELTRDQWVDFGKLVNNSFAETAAQ
ncbi:MAG: ABC transporter substrate-binding protein [Ruminococcaceae bacterium]|nr:ABC transporter substrate-binding protein [Oscillospiraceae bacterium]